MRRMTIKEATKVLRLAEIVHGAIIDQLPECPGNKSNTYANAWDDALEAIPEFEELSSELILSVIQELPEARDENK